MNTDPHIFIAIAPNHIINFENIIKSKQNIGFSILINPGDFSYDKSVWSKVINGNLDLKYIESNSIEKLKYQINKLVGYKRFIKQFHKNVSIENKYTFYYCNLDDVLTNYIFYFLNNKKLIKNNFVVEDGILNYYYPLSNKSKLKVKGFLCEKLLGIKFKPEKHHPTKIDSDIVKAQYVRLPKKAIRSEKSIELPFNDISYKPSSNITLIIGQDIMHNNEEGPKYYRNRLKRLFEHVSKGVDDNTKVIYKPHRNGDYSIAEGILQKSFKNFELYKNITPIEECITEIKPSKIYSFESSAMLNLKIAFNEAKVYIAVLPYNEKQPKLLEIFKDLGIEILR